MDKQFCPICNAEVQPSLRYPDYLCENCVTNAQSKDGKLVEFHNTNIAGGCVGQYTESKTKYDSDIVYVNGVKCKAKEARFGGIVIQPFKNQ